MGRDVKPFSVSWAQAAGGVVSSPSDLTRWVRALYQGTLLAPAQRAELLSLVSQATGTPIAQVSASDPRAFGLGAAQTFQPALGGPIYFYEGETLGYRMLYALSLIHICHAPSRRFLNPDFRLRFARIVTHYWRHAAFLEDDQLLRNVASLTAIPGVLLHGRYDVSSPLETAWQLHRRWPESELRVVDDSGHGYGSLSEHVIATLNQFRATAT